MLWRKCLKFIVLLEIFHLNYVKHLDLLAWAYELLESLYYIFMVAQIRNFGSFYALPLRVSRNGIDYSSIQKSVLSWFNQAKGVQRPADKSWR